MHHKISAEFKGKLLPLSVPLNAAVNLTGDQEKKDDIANLTVERRLKDDIATLTDARDCRTTTNNRGTTYDNA